MPEFIPYSGFTRSRADGSQASGRPCAAWPAKHIDDDAAALLRISYAWERPQTQSQSAFFLVNEWVEIAAHTLSPGINEPYAINHLGWRLDALNRLARNDIVSPHYFDGDSRLRARLPRVRLETLTNAIFDQLRDYFVGDRNSAIHVPAHIGDTG